jgi:hypothetical protein
MILSLPAALQVNYLVQIRRKKLKLDLDSNAVRFIIDESSSLGRGQPNIQPALRYGGSPHETE